MTDRPSPLRLRQFLPYRLSVLSNTISRAIAQLYDTEFGLSIWQWRVMAVLGDTPGISATDIGQRTAMDKVAVSRAIAGLTELGYVERTASKADARRFHLSLTASGADIYSAIVPMALTAEADLLGGLTDTERETFEALMNKLAAAAAPDTPLW